MLKQNKKHFLFQLFYLMINEQHASKHSIAKQYFIIIHESRHRKHANNKDID